MTWKVILEPKPQVEKICNECGKVIDTFGPTHPLTQYMIFDLQYTDARASILDTLDFGLQPYHWCPISPKSHCLVPMRTTLRETQEELEKAPKVEKFQLEHAPYKEPFKKIGKRTHGSNKGRPPTTVLETILNMKERYEQKRKDDKANSV